MRVAGSIPAGPTIFQPTPSIERHATGGVRQDAGDSGQRQASCRVAEVRALSGNARDD